MKKLFLLTLSLILFSNIALAKNYSSTKYYKLNEYNSKGQKTGYTKIYYKNDKSNVNKIEKYSTSGKRTNVYK